MAFNHQAALDGVQAYWFKKPIHISWEPEIQAWVSNDPTGISLRFNKLGMCMSIGFTNFLTMNTDELDEYLAKKQLENSEFQVY